MVVVVVVVVGESMREYCNRRKPREPVSLAAVAAVALAAVVVGQ